MKFNKEFFKRSSTYANLVSGIIASVMVYTPYLIPESYTPYVMLSFAAITTVCQLVSWKAKQ